MPWFFERSDGISGPRMEDLMRQTVAEARQRICARPRRVLLLPPDITRAHCGAGRLTEMLYHLLSGEAEVHVIPTLGQHVPHTPEENRRMFGVDPRGADPRPRLARRLRAPGRGAGRLRPPGHLRGRRLGHPHRGSTACSWRSPGT